MATRAAVLIPLVVSPHGLDVVLTRRAESLPHHQGQIAFPGGRYDPACDESLLAAALREADEEIGLRPADVEVLGALAEVQTLSSGFLISPFVGRVPPAYLYRPHAAEVAEVFAMPLRAHGDPALRTTLPWVRAGIQLAVPAIRYGEHTVWGATLRILDLLMASPILATISARP